MVYRTQKTGRGHSIAAGLIICLAVGMGIILMGSAILAQLIHKEVLEEAAAGYGVMVLVIIASYAACRTAYGRTDKNRGIVSLVTGASLFLMLLSLTAAVFEGQYQGIGATALLIVCGCGLAFLPVRRGRGTGKHYKLKMSTR